MKTHKHLRPEVRLKLLKEFSSSVEIDPTIPIKLYYKMGLNMVEMFNFYRAEGNLEEAFCLYSKYETLFRRRIRKHPQFDRLSVNVKSVNASNLRTMTPKAAKITAILLEKYKEQYLRYCKEMSGISVDRLQMHGDSFEMRDLTARICRDYLPGAWKKVTPHDIGFKHISGGLSNLLYHVALPPHLADDSEKSSCQEPKEVLIRVYGQTHGEGALEALITESVIFTLLSERGLGPKLHGIFPGGRIEQYINARPLLTRELADEKLSVQISQKMAQIHSMEVPLHKQPDWLWNTMDRWLKTCDKKFNGNVPDFAKKLLDKVDLNAETQWLRQTLERENSPVVFCHNDMQEGNILVSLDNDNNNDDPEIVIIDFEYCSYNYRGFDIANHFVEWIYDYKEEKYPFYTENPRHYPTEKQRLNFIRGYLEESGSRENPKKVLREVEVFTLASHLFWSLWGFINAETSKIPFGYWEYGCARLSNYFQLKERLSCNMKIKRKVECLSLD